MEKIIKSIPELEQFAREYLEKLTTDGNGATVVNLSGDLGSGKTAFVKAAAKSLGVFGEICSPTFVIAKFYDIPGPRAWSRLVHIDAYRIEDPLELRSLHLETLIADPQNIIIVEWPERAGTLLPPNSPTLSFRFVDETTRAILL